MLRPHACLNTPPPYSLKKYLGSSLRGVAHKVSPPQAGAVQVFGARVHVDPEPVRPWSPLTPSLPLARTHNSTAHCASITASSGEPVRLGPPTAAACPYQDQPRSPSPPRHLNGPRPCVHCNPACVCGVRAWRGSWASCCSSGCPRVDRRRLTTRRARAWAGCPIGDGRFFDGNAVAFGAVVAHCVTLSTLKVGCDSAITACCRQRPDNLSRSCCPDNQRVE